MNSNKLAVGIIIILIGVSVSLIGALSLIDAQTGRETLSQALVVFIGAMLNGIGALKVNESRKG